MKQKNNVFFGMVKYEFIRIFRNKLLLGLLLAFSVVVLLVCSTMYSNNGNCRLAIYLGDMQIEEVTFMRELGDLFVLDNIKTVGSDDEGKELLRSAKIDLFISVNEEQNPPTAIVYFDGSSVISQKFISELSRSEQQYTYEKLKEVLGTYGIKLNENYFDIVSFEPANAKEVLPKQISFSMQVACCLAIVIMFGLAYSLTKDNETNVSRNINYIPVGLNRYLLSKLVPYLIIGAVELVVLLAIGAIFFSIDYAINVVLVFLLALPFILAIGSLGLIFSLFKNQVVTVLVDVAMVMIPMFALAVSYLNAFPFIIRILLCCSPISTFIQFMNSIVFNGTILWWMFGLFLLQAVGYYLIALLILRRRVRK